MTNEELFNYCFNGHKSPVSIRMRWHNIKCHSDIYNYMINYFEDADDTNSSAPEILYRIIHNILVRPKCLVCGKPAKFTRFDRGYGEFCSEECRRSKEGERIVREKTTKTFLKNYGCINASQNKEVKEKMKNTCKERYGGNSPMSSKDVVEKQLKNKREKYGEHFEKIIEKTKKTLKERYGVEAVMQNPESLQKMISKQIQLHGGLFNPEKSKQTCLERYGTKIYASSEDIKIKRYKTLMKHYGVDIPLKNKNILNEQKKTMLEKYGYDHNFKRPEIIEKLKSKEIREQQWETKKKIFIFQF